MYPNSPNPWDQYMQQMQNAYAQRRPAYQGQIITVNGINGANVFDMAPNSSVILMDESGKMAFIVKTDGAGYKSVLPCDLTPHQDASAPDLGALEARITKLEEAMHNVNKSVPDPAVPAAGKRLSIPVDDE